MPQAVLIIDNTSIHKLLLIKIAFDNYNLVCLQYTLPSCSQPMREINTGSESNIKSNASSKKSCKFESNCINNRNQAKPTRRFYQSKSVRMTRLIKFFLKTRLKLFCVKTHAFAFLLGFFVS